MGVLGLLLIDGDGGIAFKNGQQNSQVPQSRYMNLHILQALHLQTHIQKLHDAPSTEQFRIPMTWRTVAAQHRTTLK